MAVERAAMKSFVQRRAALPVLGWLATAVTPLCAQQAIQSTPGGMQQSSIPAPQFGNTGGAEQEQSTPAPKPTLIIEPRLTLGQTLTKGGLGADGESDAISRITPGLYVSRRAGKVQGFLDYALTGVAYARASGFNEVRNTLRANANAELVDRYAFVDAQASITQQAVDPLGVDSEDDQVSRANRTEVRTVQLTPRVQGRLGDVAQWVASVSQRLTHSDAASTSNSSSTQWQLQAGSASQQRSTISWAAQLSHSAQHFSRGRSTEDDTARVLADWRFNPEFSAGVIAGYESTNIASEDKQGNATYGLRMSWIPSERTRLVAEAEKRYFGNFHNLVFSHRMARSVVSYADTRAVSYGQGQPLVVGRGSVYDFFDQLYSSNVPDAGEREAKVLGVLRNNGLSTTDSTGTLPAFLTSSLTLQRTQQISYSWAGVRDTISVSMQQTSGQRVESQEVFGDPFTANFRIRQRGFSVLATHRLTTLSNLTLLMTQRRSIGDVDSTRLRSVTTQFSTPLGYRTRLGLSARHASFKSLAQSYTESALVGTLSMTF